MMKHQAIDAGLWLPSVAARLGRSGARWKGVSAALLLFEDHPCVEAVQPVLSCLADEEHAYRASRVISAAPSLFRAPVFAWLESSKPALSEDAVQELRRELGDTSVPIDQAAFVAAVLALDVPTVERGLAQGCDPKDGYGAVASPLHQLMYAWDGTQPIESMLTMVRTLVAAGADPEERLSDRWRDEDEFLDVARGATPADLVRSSLAGSNADPALGAQADRLLAALGETREPAARKKPTRR